MKYVTRILAAAIIIVASASKAETSVDSATGPWRRRRAASLSNRFRFRAASNKRRVLPAKQRAQAEPTSPVAPMTRSVSQSSGRPSRRAARSMPRTINAAVRVLPVVRCRCRLPVSDHFDRTK
jgi:hypothetical protein